MGNNSNIAAAKYDFTPNADYPEKIVVRNGDLSEI
jgi:hypothetical protein